MKKVLLAITIIFACFEATAQNYETIKKMLNSSQSQDAKPALDQSMIDAKFTSKPEAYILKASVYAALSTDNKYKNTAAGDQLTNDGDAAFRKYREMEPGLALMKDPVYQNGALNLYSSYYVSGYTDYVAKKWNLAHSKLKKAVEYSDLLIKYKLLKVPIDTNLLVLAGITAENGGLINEATQYYVRLADNKIAGEGFESVYRYLVNNYFQSKDYVSFEKYKAIGAQMYPQSEYFRFDKVDFTVGLSPTFSAKVKALDELLLKDPNDFKTNQVLGETIYDTLNPKEATSPLPANANELERKMIAAFKKAALAKPGYENSYVNIGDHFINKAVAVDVERQILFKAIDAKTKSGTAASREDISKSNALDKKYGDDLEQAREPYEKAAQLYSARSNLSLAEKKQYKKAVSYLADIASFKRIQNKDKPADAAKYAADEKKWVAVWESIK